MILHICILSSAFDSEPISTDSHSARFL